MPAQSPQDSITVLQRRLRKAVQALKAEAGGRVCGDCAYASLGIGGSGFCSQLVNYEGGSLQINRRDAVACAAFRHS